MHVEFSYVKVYETEAVCGEHHLGRNSRWRGICGRERTGGSDRRPVERRIPTPPSSLTIRAMSVIVSGRPGVDGRPEMLRPMQYTLAHGS